jgi:hypothetical protein
MAHYRKHDSFEEIKKIWTIGAEIFTLALHQD